MILATVFFILWTGLCQGKDVRNEITLAEKEVEEIMKIQNGLHPKADLKPFRKHPSSDKGDDNEDESVRSDFDNSFLISGINGQVVDKQGFGGGFGNGFGSLGGGGGMGQSGFNPPFGGNGAGFGAGGGAQNFGVGLQGFGSHQGQLGGSHGFGSQQGQVGGSHGFEGQQGLGGPQGFGSQQGFGAGLQGFGGQQGLGRPQGLGALQGPMNSGFHNGLSNFNNGLGSRPLNDFAGNVNPGFGSGHNQGFGVGGGINPGLQGGVSPAFGPGLNVVSNPGFQGGINPALVLGNNVFNSGINNGFNPGFSGPQHGGFNINPGTIAMFNPQLGQGFGGLNNNLFVGANNGIPPGGFANGFNRPISGLNNPSLGTLNL